jgi:hypothetical protein
MRQERVAADRQHIRAEMLAKKISGLAISKTDGRESAFFIWDVSPEGIGIWMSETYQIGEELQLIIKDSADLKVTGTVQWLRQQDEMGGIRCGLKITAGLREIGELYSKHREKSLQLPA